MPDNACSGAGSDPCCRKRDKLYARSESVRGPLVHQWLLPGLLGLVIGAALVFFYDGLCFQPPNGGIKTVGVLGVCVTKD